MKLDHENRNLHSNHKLKHHTLRVYLTGHHIFMQLRTTLSNNHFNCNITIFNQMIIQGISLVTNLQSFDF